jgi:biotin-dependent carboxylase-like uncharacterized protein
VIAVVKAGLLTTVQDRGRPGYAHLGVSRSGALDIPALARANAHVGNPDGAAGLETTLTGVSLRTESAVRFAVTGAAAQITVDGETVAFDAPVEVAAGVTIVVGPATAGVRSYVAFAGGIRVAPVLDSRSTDTLSGLGPPPLRPGFVLPIGSPRLLLDPPPSPRPETTGDRADVSITVHLGPRDDWFTTKACETLLSQPYTLSVKSNRVGARLTGPTLTRASTGELPSEGIVLGAIQVPADGQPLIFLADHPTTGGYPVIAVVDPTDLPLLAQARPGTRVWFVRAQPWT